MESGTKIITQMIQRTGPIYVPQASRYMASVRVIARSVAPFWIIEKTIAMV